MDTIFFNWENSACYEIEKTKRGTKERIMTDFILTG